MEHERNNFLVFFGPLFALLPPPMDPGNQNFEISKNTPGDIITFTI